MTAANVTPAMIMALQAAAADLVAAYGAQPATAPTAAPVSPSPAAPGLLSGNPFTAATLYVDPDNSGVTPTMINNYGTAAPANYCYGSASSPYPGQAAAQKALRTLVAVPQPTWLTTSSDPAMKVPALISGAKHTSTLPCLLTYYIPDRDNGGAQSGGAPSLAIYLSWINSIVAARATIDPAYPCVIILEPDAVNLAASLSPADAAVRFACLTYASQTLSAAGFIVYIDAGSSYWAGDFGGPGEAVLLQKAGIQYARGFATNTSNFALTEDEVTFGNGIIAALAALGHPNAHQVIDTSRNGFGPARGIPSPQYNPPGRAAGDLPTSQVSGHHNADSARQDAFLWIKTPLYTDFGIRGPASGPYPDYAIDMLNRTPWFGAFDPSVPVVTN
jgi:endoglucanase